MWPRPAAQPTAPPGLSGQWAFAAYPRSQAPCGIPRPIDRAGRHSRPGLPRPPETVWHHQRGFFALQVQALKRPQAVALKGYIPLPPSPSSITVEPRGQLDQCDLIVFTSVDRIPTKADNYTYRSRSGSGARIERRQPLRAYLAGDTQCLQYQPLCSTSLPLKL